MQKPQFFCKKMPIGVKITILLFLRFYPNFVRISIDELDDLVVIKLCVHLHLGEKAQKKFIRELHLFIYKGEKIKSVKITHFLCEHFF